MLYTRLLAKYESLELAVVGDNLARCSAQLGAGTAQKAQLSTQFLACRRQFGGSGHHLSVNSP